MKERGNGNRLSRLLAREPADIPVIITGAAQAALMAGCDPGAMRRDGSLLARVQRDFRVHTGMDWTVVYADAMAVPEALGIRVRMTGSVPVAETVLDVENFTGFREDPWTETASTNAILEALAQLRSPTEGTLAVLFEGPFTTAMRLFEPEKLLRQIFLRPAFLHDVVDQITDRLQDLTTLACRAGAAVFYLPEPFLSVDMLSPRHSRVFGFPHLSFLVEHIHGLGGRVILHICGSTTQVWLDMAATGADALSLDQRMSLREARRCLGPDAILAGNVDPVAVLFQGDGSLVADQTNRCIEEGGPGNFILMPGCGVPPGTDPANLRVMVATVRRYGGSS